MQQPIIFEDDYKRSGLEIFSEENQGSSNQFIINRILLEAKRLLLYTDPAYFKKITLRKKYNI